MLMSNKNHNIRFAHEETRKMGLLLSDDGKIEKINEWAIEDRNKLEALCDYYGISDTSEKFYELSLALAREFLSNEKKKGKRKKWNEFIRGTLVVEIEQLIDKKGSNHGVSWACGILSQKAPWDNFITINEGVVGSKTSKRDVIRQQYYESKDLWTVSIVRDSFEYHKSQNDIEGWSSRVLAIVKHQGT